MPKEHKYWTYIVASKTGTLYIGMTNNLERRIKELKDGSYRQIRLQSPRLLGKLRRRSQSH